MPTVEIGSYEEYRVAKKAQTILSEFMQDGEVKKFVDSLSFTVPQYQQRHGEEEPISNYEVMQRMRLQAEEQALRLRELEKAIAIQEEIAERAFQEVKAKSPEFTLPAFKAMEELKACLSSQKKYPSLSCMVSYFITLASIIVPFANPLGKQ